MNFEDTGGMAKQPLKMTYEEVAYRLKYYGDDDEIERSIIKTVLRLPGDVGYFALDRCRFLSVGRASIGMTLPGRVGGHHNKRDAINVWLIILAEGLPLGDEHSLIAHAIAHAWRGDDRLISNSGDCEVKAAGLVREWGFTGMGAAPKRCNF